MSDPNRPKRSKPKKESGLHGKHYERKVFTLTALKCLLDENIKDFWLLSNPGEVNKFDDIILSTVYNNGERKLFMTQVKHRQQGTNHPVIADKLDGDDKDLSLAMYEKAFFEIKANEDFLKANDVCHQTDMIFILFNNCKVTREKKNDNIAFDSNCDKCFRFIDTSKNTGVVKIVNKTGKYDQNFLDRFYFYTEQLANEQLINIEIGNLLGIKEDTVQSVLNFFYSWIEPKDDCIKLTKLDIKIKLLDILLGDFQPPRDLNNVTNSKLINVINKFNATVITEEDSSVTVWSEIFHEIRHFCEDSSLKPTTWEELVQKQVEEKFPHFRSKETLLTNNRGISIRLAYIFLVAQRKIPFFITTNNRLFDSFNTKFSRALDVYSVVYNIHKERITFLDTTKVFQNLSNIEYKLYFQHSNQLLVSFQGKVDIDLYKLVCKDDKIKQQCSVDNYIELLHKTCTIGETNLLPPYYVNREIRIPILRQDVFDEKEFFFFIFQFPKREKIESRRHIDLLQYLLKFYDEMYGEPRYIITTQKEFNSIYINLIEKILRNRIYFILKYIGKDSFMLLRTNGPTDILRSYLTYTDKNDEQLYKINNNCNVNIICNNAGMGKSTFLTFINSKLSPDEWVIHIDLKKYCDRIKHVKTLEELIAFSYNCQNTNMSESFRNFFETLYGNLKRKVIWLIDDYEEINQPVLLELFKLAGEKGFRIWIVARPLLKSEFENVFGVFSMELAEFDKEDQKTFTAKYLREKNKSEEDIKKIMTAIGNIRHLLEDSFIGSCQQTMMLTEIFLNYESSWKEHEWRIHDIYERFINLKVSDNYGVKREWYLRTLSKLALKVFFKDEALKTVFDLEEFEEDVRIFKSSYPKDFFISEFAENDVPIFSHRTYAEFLAARWLLHTVKKQMARDTPFNISVIFRMLHLKELTSVRLFFDNMATKQLPVHCAIVNKDKIGVLANEHISKTDLMGRSVLHLVSSYGNYFDIGITKETTNLVRNLDAHSQVVPDDGYVLLKPIESMHSDISNSNVLRYLPKLSCLTCILAILKEDTFLKLNSIDYALMSGSLLELDALLILRNLATDERALTLPSEETKYCILFHCIRHNYTNILSTLDVKGLNNLKIDPSKGSLLHLAVGSKNLEAVKKLTEQHCLEQWGVDVKGNTPLHIACDQKDDSMLEYLSKLVHDVDVDFLNRKNFKGESHLHFLARRGHTKWIKQITRVRGVIVDSEDCNGITPFMLSVIFYNTNAAAMLRTRGADVNHANVKQMTALHYASSKGFLKCVEKLLEWKADINKKDNFGKTPLMQASAWDHKNVVALLLVNHAKVNLCDNNKWTALHHGVRRNNIEVIELLLIYKASGRIVNTNRESPLIIASKYNYTKAMKLLLDYNVTHGKKLALKISINKNHKGCIDLLLQAGATF